MTRKYLILSVLLVLGHSSLLTLSPTSESDSNQIPKLPVYVGIGYNILYGNPLHTSRVDPGFGHKFLDFTYTKGQTTQDNRYLIPDGVTHSKTTSCSFSTETSSFRGTQNYQKILNTKAQIQGGYNGALVKASFSSSTAYEKLSNTTIHQRKTVTHAMAQCQNYRLSIDLFSVDIAITNNFLLGVQQSYKTKNWTNFVNQFGTHFVYEVIMGGRAIQQTEYSRTNESKLESVGVDVNVAAKASYAKFYADTSFDWKKHQTDISYSDNMKSSVSEIYIGGQPPRNGSIKDWQSKVIQDPMPITYKMLPLSDLFKRLKNPKIDLQQAINQFLGYLETYCQERNCQTPLPDNSKPTPATLQETRSDARGGNGGGDFNWKYGSTTLQMSKAHIRCGKEIDNIQLALSDGIKTIYTPKFGGNDGGQVTWDVPQGQFVSQIEYRTGDRVDSLTFITNKGVRSPKFGGGGGGYSLVTLPEGFRIIGMYGKCGKRVDKLGFNLAKTVYHSNDEKSKVIYQDLLLE